MLTSDRMYKRGKYCFNQSQKAFEAEMTMDPFLSAELGFKMLSTSGYHFARCIANLGLALYCIPNMLVRAFKEDDVATVGEHGFEAMGYHIAAAAIDFANIFFTVGAVFVRAIATWLEKWDADDRAEKGSVVDTLIYTAGHISNSLQAGAANRGFTTQGRQYTDATALEFSPCTLSM